MRALARSEELAEAAVVPDADVASFKACVNADALPVLVIPEVRALASSELVLRSVRDTASNADVALFPLLLLLSEPLSSLNKESWMRFAEKYWDLDKS